MASNIHSSGVRHPPKANSQRHSTSSSSSPLSNTDVEQSSMQIGSLLGFYSNHTLDSEDKWKEASSKFRSLACKFLMVTPFEHRFSDKVVSKALKNCVYTNAQLPHWTPLSAAESFRNLENIVLNFIRAPWKPEYKQIKTFTGSYRHKLCVGLGEEVRALLHSVGYVTRKDSLTYELYSLPSVTYLTELAANLCLASEECNLMNEVCILNSTKCLGFSKLQCCTARLQTAAAPEICLNRLLKDGLDKPSFRNSLEDNQCMSVEQNIDLNQTELIEDEHNTLKGTNNITGKQLALSQSSRDPSLSPWILLPDGVDSYVSICDNESVTSLKNSKSISENVSKVSVEKTVPKATPEEVELKDDILDSPPPVPRRNSSRKFSSLTTEGVRSTSMYAQKPSHDHHLDRKDAKKVFEDLDQPVIRDKYFKDIQMSKIEPANSKTRSLNRPQHSSMTSTLTSLSPSAHWTCSGCTFKNTKMNFICDMCSRSRDLNRTPDKPLPVGGPQCDRCTLVNKPGTESCTSCDASLQNAPTYL